MPTTAGLTASHTSTKGVPVTRTWGWRMVVRQPGLLAAGDEVVDEHAQAVAGAGAEVVDDLGQVVDAVESLDDDALDPKVVAPHLLDQLGVVDALHQDAAGPRHPGPVPPATAREPEVVVAGAVGAALAGGAGSDEADCPALDVEGAGGGPEEPFQAGGAPDDHARRPRTRTTTPVNPLARWRTARPGVAVTSG